jgi:hypothetical protein
MLFRGVPARHRFNGRVAYDQMTLQLMLGTVREVHVAVVLWSYFALLLGQLSYTFSHLQQRDSPTGFV